MLLSTKLNKISENLNHNLKLSGGK